MSDFPSEKLPMADIRQQFELAKNDLRLALMFAKLSSTAYSMGRLQHAWDARAKAEAVRQRAVAQLMGALADDDKSVGSMLAEVQTALAGLPSSRSPHFWAPLTVRRSAV
jgi:hypothetical protein